MNASYQKQRDRRADLWFAAHEMVFEQKPAAMGTPAFMIIDESAWQDGLIGIDAGERTLSLDTLARGDTIPDAPMATDRLRFLRQRMFDALSLTAGWANPARGNRGDRYHVAISRRGAGSGVAAEDRTEDRARHAAV